VLLISDLAYLGCSVHSSTLLEQLPDCDCVPLPACLMQGSLQALYMQFHVMDGSLFSPLIILLPIKPDKLEAQTLVLQHANKGVDLCLLKHIPKYHRFC